jgi:hypothetical protein
MRVEQGELHGGADWPIDLAAVLVALGRGSDLRELAASKAVCTPWLEAAAAFAGSDFERAADQYAMIGSLPDEAFARLRTAEQLLTTGHRTSGNTQLQRAVSFYRKAQATATCVRPRRCWLPQRDLARESVPPELRGVRVASPCSEVSPRRRRRCRARRRSDASVRR